MPIKYTPSEAYRLRQEHIAHEADGKQRQIRDEIRQHADALAEFAVNAYATNSSHHVACVPNYLWGDGSHVAHAAARIARARGYATCVLDNGDLKSISRPTLVVSVPKATWWGRLWQRLCGWTLPA